MIAPYLENSIKISSQCCATAWWFLCSLSLVSASAETKGFHFMPGVNVSFGVLWVVTSGHVSIEFSLFDEKSYWQMIAAKIYLNVSQMHYLQPVKCRENVYFKMFIPCQSDIKGYCKHFIFTVLFPLEFVLYITRFVVP